MTDLVHAVTLETLRDMLQALGFRASIGPDGRAVQSATNGMGFEARLGNPASDGEDGAVDFRLVAAIRVEGGLDLALVNSWNNGRRFCRLHLDGGTLLLDMDVSVAGGVAPAHLAGQLEIWNRVVEALREFLRSGGKDADRQPQAESPAAERRAASG